MPELIDALRKKLDEAKEKNKGLSMRWLAKKVDLSSGALSEILAGKRVPTKANALKIIQALNLSERERARLEFLVTGDPLLKRRELSPEEFSVFERWLVRLLFELCARPGGMAIEAIDAKWLGVKKDEVRAVLVSLLEQRLVQEVRPGVFERAPEQLATSNGSFNQVVRAMHHSDLLLLQERLEKGAVDDRLFHSVIFNCRQKDIGAIKKDLGDYIARLQLLYEAPDGEGACFVGVSMVDFSQATPPTAK